MKRRFAALLLVAVLTFTLCTPAFASTRAIRVIPQLSFSGTTANCAVTVSAIDQDIDATLELWYNGYIVKSWSGSGESFVSISGSRVCISGFTYSVRVTGTVDGSYFESVYVTQTCP